MVNFNEIAEDSPCARVCRQERHSRVVDFSINVADAAIGLRRLQKQRNVDKKHCFTAVELEKNVTSYEIYFTAVELEKNVTSYEIYLKILEHYSSIEKLKNAWPQYERNKSNSVEPHFPTSATKSLSLEDTKTAVALPHCSESTRDSIAGWWTFRLEVTPELWRKYGTSYVKTTEVDVLPVVDLSGKIGFSVFFLWAMQHSYVGPA